MKRATLFLLGFLAALGFGAAAAGAATPAPAWTISSVATPTDFVPEDLAGDYTYEVRIVNSGGSSTNGSPVTITDTLPAGLDVTQVDFNLRYDGNGLNFGPEIFGICETDKPAAVATVTCTIPSEFPPLLPETSDEPSTLLAGEELRMVVHVATPLAAAGQALLNRVEVKGGGAFPAEAVSQNHATLQGAPAGLTELPPSGLAYFNSLLSGVDGRLAGEAASHPYQYTTGFSANSRGTPAGTVAPIAASGGDLKDIRVELPPGLIGNPLSATRCTAQQFNTTFTIEGSPTNIVTQNECPDGSAIGFVVLRRIEDFSGRAYTPLYNLVPPKGMPAQLGFQFGTLPFYVDTEVRTGGDYGITGVLRKASQARRLIGASLTLWGTPAAASHDAIRGHCLNQDPEKFSISLGDCGSGIEPKPFLRLPTNCDAAMTTTMSVNTWNRPGSFASSAVSAPAASGCAPVAFDPSITATPETTVADSPSGLNVHLHLPQSNDQDQLATADLEDLTVTLPAGVSVNPSSAAGLAGCSPAQIDLKGPGPANCPDAAKIGSVEVRTPLLDHPVNGAVYVASQEDNPFNSLIAIYITAYDPQTGVVLKLAGKVEPDPATGQLRTTFTDNPQLPFEDLTTLFFDGPRAPLRTPTTCGTYRTQTSMTPWSAPYSGPPATPSDSFTVTRAPNGNCANSEGEQPNDPSFEAGTVSPVAGAYSPLVVNLRRADGSQYLRGLNVRLPPGLVGKLAGVPYCSEAALAAAAAKSGRAEQASASCPAASQVGSVSVGSGAGPSPLYVGGKAYLSGPYKGAPLSLAVVTPALAGPFDLGTVVVRSELRVDPTTAQVTAVSDPFPTILRGIPLDLRSVSVQVDRPEFTLNPTNCEPLQVTGEAISLANGIAALLNRFQVGGCRGLDFAPSVTFRLKGSTKRGANPQFRTELKAKPGEANIGRVSAALPHSEFLDQAHIRTICTRVQFAADQCPSASVYGRARAFTPLLEQPLEGPVYLRSSNNPLPDLVADLKGQVRLTLVGRIDSVRGGIRTIFNTVPDAPVKKFVLQMQGGKKGLLVNSRNLCRSTNRVTVKMTGQNGRRHEATPALKDDCGKRKKK